MTHQRLTSGVVLRLAKDRKGISPFPQRARIEDFEPSSEDKAGAAGHAGDVLISVFDRERTTVVQILAIRGLEDLERPTYALSVEGLALIKAAGREALYVVRDPLPEPKASLPGADGHCGMGDLARRPGEPRAVIRDLCSRLVDLAVFCR